VRARRSAIGTRVVVLCGSLKDGFFVVEHEEYEGGEAGEDARRISTRAREDGHSNAEARSVPSVAHRGASSCRGDSIYQNIDALSPAPTR
jgi:hypothetical protein